MTAQVVRAVRNARVPGRSGLADLTIADGRWAEVRDASGAPVVAGELDAAGRLVAPGLVDAHVHLDKAYLNDDLERSGIAIDDLEGAIRATRALRVRQGGDRVAAIVAGAERALAAMLSHGTTAARVHVEIDAEFGVEVVDAHRELNERWADRMELQLVAFPQHGLADPRTRRLMELAIERGCSVIGGCPYADDDPRDHIDYVTDVAAQSGCRLDAHIDFSDDPAEAWIDVLLDYVDKRQLGGRLAVGHLTSLAVAADPDADRRIRRLAETGTAVISLPTTDIYLNGRHHPPARGITPLARLLAAGVRVALGTNNHQNPFTPVGTGNLLQVAWLASLLGHFSSVGDHERLLAMVSTEAAEVIGVAPWALEAGAPASCIVVDAPHGAAVVRDVPRIQSVVSRGRLVA